MPLKHVFSARRLDDRVAIFTMIEWQCDLPWSQLLGGGPFSLSHHLFTFYLLALTFYFLQRVDAKIQLNELNKIQI